MLIPVQDYIRSLSPYIPGKPIEETQREPKLKKVIKLASNENPLGPSPLAILAIQKALLNLHRYPDGSGYSLKKLLAKSLGISTQSLILGNGSNEIIDQVIRTFCVPGDQIVTSKASFIAYKICAQIHGVSTLEIRLDEQLGFDVDEMLDCIKQNERVKIVFLANPNNPTGNYLNINQLNKLVSGLSAIRDGSVGLVLDYAYWEYVTAVDLPDPIKYLKKYPNLLILRTFSKVYGLAGSRLGFGIGSPEWIANLEKVRMPFNVNSLALVGAEAAFSDAKFIKKSQIANQAGMKFWTKELQRLSIPYWNSQGNFLLVNVRQGLGKSGPEIYEECLRKGVIFRPVNNYGLMDSVRITFGTESENRIAIRALDPNSKKREPKK